MNEAQKPKPDAVRSAIRALEKLTPEERLRVIKAAVALWGIEVGT